MYFDLTVASILLVFGVQVVSIEYWCFKKVSLMSSLMKSVDLPKLVSAHPPFDPIIRQIPETQEHNGQIAKL